VLGVLALGWTAFTVGWIRIGHPANAVATGLIVVADMLWVVRTGHAATGVEADDRWSRRAVPVGLALVVFSFAAMTPSRSTTLPSGVIALSVVFWVCVSLAVWLTGTPARVVSRAPVPVAPVARQRRPGPVRS